jgi:hypothetical protein
VNSAQATREFRGLCPDDSPRPSNSCDLHGQPAATGHPAADRRHVRCVTAVQSLTTLLKSLYVFQTRGGPLLASRLTCGHLHPDKRLPGLHFPHPRAVPDVTPGQLAETLRQQITVIFVDRYFPSSKRCSDCGHVLDDLRLDEREWTCPKCGCVHDRDLNAAVASVPGGRVREAGPDLLGEHGSVPKALLQQASSFRQPDAGSGPIERRCDAQRKAPVRSGQSASSTGTVPAELSGPCSRQPRTSPARSCVTRAGRRLPAGSEATVRHARTARRG